MTRDSMQWILGLLFSAMLAVSFVAWAYWVGATGGHAQPLPAHPWHHGVSFQIKQLRGPEE